MGRPQLRGIARTWREATA